MGHAVHDSIRFALRLMDAMRFVLLNLFRHAERVLQFSGSVFEVRELQSWVVVRVFGKLNRSERKSSESVTVQRCLKSP